MSATTRGRWNSGSSGSRTGGGGVGGGAMLYVYAVTLLVLVAVKTSLALPPFHIRSDSAVGPSEAALDWMQRLQAQQSRFKRFPPFHLKRSLLRPATVEDISDDRSLDNVDYLSRSLHRLINGNDPQNDDRQDLNYLIESKPILLVSDFSLRPSSALQDASEEADRR